jgi:hypothetical protein
MVGTEELLRSRNRGNQRLVVGVLRGLATKAGLPRNRRWSLHELLGSANRGNPLRRLNRMRTYSAAPQIREFLRSQRLGGYCVARPSDAGCLLDKLPSPGSHSRNPSNRGCRQATLRRVTEINPAGSVSWFVTRETLSRFIVLPLRKRCPINNDDDRGTDAG